MMVNLTVTGMENRLNWGWMLGWHVYVINSKTGTGCLIYHACFELMTKLWTDLLCRWRLLHPQSRKTCMAANWAQCGSGSHHRGQPQTVCKGAWRLWSLDWVLLSEPTLLLVHNYVFMSYVAPYSMIYAIKYDSHCGWGLRGSTKDKSTLRWKIGREKIMTKLVSFG
jgi:hypothetical protein